MILKLSTLSILLGLGFSLPQVYGLVKPAAFAGSVRGFPRSVPWGVVLMLLGTAWFLWNVFQETNTEILIYKRFLIPGFAAVGIGSAIFIQDFLAVRGLAVVLLLLAKLMTDSGRPMLSATHWTWVIQGWAYLYVAAGVWFTISPWRLRDWLNWITANEKRVRIGSVVRLAFGLFVAALGLVKF
jgi:hypothetical protein